MTGVTGDGRWVTGQPRDLTATLRLVQAGAGWCRQDCISATSASGEFVSCRRAGVRGETGILGEREMANGR